MPRLRDPTHVFPPASSVIRVVRAELRCRRGRGLHPASIAELEREIGCGTDALRRPLRAGGFSSIRRWAAALAALDLVIVPRRDLEPRRRPPRYRPEQTGAELQGDGRLTADEFQRRLAVLRQGLG